MMKQLEQLQAGELKSLLSSLRSFGDMKKKLWKRGVKLFQSSLSGKEFYKVEYYPVLGEDEVFSQALAVYKKSFSCSPEKSHIVFEPSESLAGGMRVIKNDEMVDLSYTKVAKLLQK